jgi:hypothetical protein
MCLISRVDNDLSQGLRQSNAMGNGMDQLGVHHALTHGNRLPLSYALIYINVFQFNWVENRGHSGI